MNPLIEETKKWFHHRHLTDAVVGYSGGVDSSTTAALLSRAGIRVHLVVSESINQAYSSPYGGLSGAQRFVESVPIHGSIQRISYPFLFDLPSANEAAAPIFRVATFYGVCAQLRSQNRSAVVVGTINFDEGAYLGFWGKASDAAQDFYPISHLHKSEVRALALALGVPDAIIYAVPSGDLLFSKTNDLEMIGANYDQIERIAKTASDEIFERELNELIESVSDSKRFCHQIISNQFKYEIPIGGFHLKRRLEEFRQLYYPRILRAAKRKCGSL